VIIRQVGAWTTARPVPPTIRVASGRERHIVESAVHAVTEQAVKADHLVDEAISTGFGRSDMLVLHAKMLRLELPWDLKHDPRKEGLGGTKTVYEEARRDRRAANGLHDFSPVHPTGQKSKRSPQVDGHVLRVSGRHAKLRREGHRKRER
jgi:hypothetical protein